MPHPRGGYRDSAGRVVPGVTKALEVLAKPALIGWANKLGLQGRTLSEALRDSANRGTNLHAQFDAVLRGGTPASRPAEQFLEWLLLVGVQRPPMLTEQPFVSDEWGFGGTPDAVVQMPGGLTLLDFKTGSGIYPEHLYQAGAYLRLIQYAGVPATSALVVLVPASGGPVQHREVSDPDRALKVVRLCAELYRLLQGEEAEEVS